MLTRLFDHMLWADQLARQEIAGMPEVTPEAGRALAIYAHLAATAEVWLSRVEGRAQRYPAWPSLSLDEAAVLVRESATRLRQLAAAPAQELAREVTYRNSSGQEFCNSVQDILTHVALHGAYHRGQLALLTRDGQAEPINTDYISYVRQPAP
ncbi:MAG TPA: DinB family protein [Longimicrobiales bacterium]